MTADVCTAMEERADQHRDAALLLSAGLAQMPGAREFMAWLLSIHGRNQARCRALDVSPPSLTDTLDYCGLVPRESVENAYMQRQIAGAVN